jgi:phage terminase large subunit-like protein
MSHKLAKLERKKVKLHPTHQYAENVASGKIDMCKWVRLACERHLYDLTREDVWFDEKAANEFFNYCTFLKHYKGPERGKSIKLNDWQKFVFGCIYGWKRVDKDTGERLDIWRFNIVYIEIPRKNGKTTLAAAGASYDAAFMENMGAEVYCLATKEDQAKILLNDVCAYIAQSNDLHDIFEILKGQNTVYVRSSARTSFVKPLGADSKRLDGLNPFSAYCDELHQWPKRDLWDVMEDAFGARTNWHMVAITTAGHNQQGVCYQERSHLIDILERRVEADNKFGVIYTVDEHEEVDWKNPDNWYKANPNLDCGKQFDYMVHKSTKAGQIPSELNAFLNKQLNIWTDVAEAWLNTETWKDAKRVFDKQTLKGKVCRAAVDLAEVNDLSAVAYWFPKQEGLPCAHLLVEFYMPEDELRNKSERDGVSYNDWVKAGHIKATPGNVTDYKFIDFDILANAKIFKIEGVSFDPFKARDLINRLMEEGIECWEFRQGFLSMGPATAEFERELVSGGFCHNGNPVMEWCVVNTIVIKDPAGLMKPCKKTAEKNKKRIDGVVASVMAVGSFALKQAQTKSVFETRNMRVL